MMSKNVVSIATMGLALASFVSVLTAETAFAQDGSRSEGTSSAPLGTQQGSVTQTVPPADTNAQPPNATEEADPLIWRGSTFTFNQAVTSTAVGIGRDNIGGEGEYYGLDFTLAPRLYLLDLEKDKIYATVEAGFAVELTNSDTTTTRNEPYFKDLQAGIAYARNLFLSEDKEWSTDAAIRGRFIFPTSPTSYNQGRLLTTSLGASVGQTIRLLGNAADGLNNITVTAGFTWAHLFSRSYSPVNGDLQRTRQNATGASFESDQLTFNSLDIDRLIPSIALDLPLYKDLSLATQFRLIGRFKHKYEGTDCDVELATGCVSGASSPDAVTYVTNSTFDVALTQGIYDVVDVTLGYNNETLTLGEDGQNRNIFYSPDAQFYLDITANIDVIYSKASGRDKKAVASYAPPSF